MIRYNIDIVQYNRTYSSDIIKKHGGPKTSIANYSGFFFNPAGFRVLGLETLFMGRWPSEALKPLVHQP